MFPTNSNKMLKTNCCGCWHGLGAVCCQPPDGSLVWWMLTQYVAVMFNGQELTMFHHFSISPLQAHSSSSATPHLFRHATQRPRLVQNRFNSDHAED